MSKERPSYEPPKIAVDPYDSSIISPATAKLNAEMRKLANIAQTGHPWRAAKSAPASQPKSKRSLLDVLKGLFG